MDSDPCTLTALLLDPCLTMAEAVREAAATPRPADRRDDRPREAWRDRPETLA